MKKFKLIYLSLAFLLMGGLVFTSCQKEESNPIPQEFLDVMVQEDGKTIFKVHELNNSNQEATYRGRYDGPTDCPYEDCSTAIPATQAEYQWLANQLGYEFFVEVVCCSDGYITYALVIIRPNVIYEAPHEVEECC